MWPVMVAARTPRPAVGRRERGSGSLAEVRSLQSSAAMKLGYAARMRAVILEVPERWLEERRNARADRRDEVWAGVLHMVPPASGFHQLLLMQLANALTPIAARRGLAVICEAGLLDPIAGWEDYRVPDLAVFELPRLSSRGIEGRAELVIEILSPHDESRDKLAFYAAQQVQEIWLVHREPRDVEVYALVGDRYTRVPTVGGVIRSPRFAIELEVVGDAILRIRDADQVAEV
jgi:Uma2 family endonuclease